MQRKTELVLRLLRGEVLDAVSRESQIPAHEFERAGKRVFLETGTRGPKTRADPDEVFGKRGPTTVVNDADLLVAIRDILQTTPFHGEGYRKVRARLAHRGVAVSGKRVLRLMRAHGLLAPRRLGPPNGNPAHDGTITTDRPDVMWGTDGTRFYTEREGWRWFFGAIDHYTDELLGWHVVKRGDRWAALEPIRQGVRHAFGGFGKDIARGLQVRCDWGPQYIADAWINEVKWLGITITPSYVGEHRPTSGSPSATAWPSASCARSRSSACTSITSRALQARAIIAAFIARYNTEWLIQRLGHLAPAQARAEATPRAA